MASTMQLEFSQAMSDFKTMFPEMDRDVIEAVLRANQGAVDATIDQLLAMSTDNQNEKLRIELENSSNSPPNAERNDILITTADETSGVTEVKLIDTSEPLTNSLISSSPLMGNNFQSTNILSSTGASPKVKNSVLTTTTGTPKSLINSSTDSPTKTNTTLQNDNGSVVCVSTKKWNPPLLSPLPPTFLRLNPIPGAHGTDSTQMRNDFDLPDEQFAMMLQNEEFMNELRWNQEFMSALEKEQQGKTEDDDMAFKDRVRHMGKVSRKKFLQVARVFTWQRNKSKVTSAKQIDSLPLKEEHSDDEDHPHKIKK